MTVNEYKAANKRYYFALLFFMFTVIGAILFTPILESVSAWVASTPELPGWVESNLKLIEVAIFIIPAVLVAQVLLPKCASCNKRMSASEAATIIANKKCTNCGETTID